MHTEMLHYRMEINKINATKTVIIFLTYYFLNAEYKISSGNIYIIHAPTSRLKPI